MTYPSEENTKPSARDIAWLEKLMERVAGNVDKLNDRIGGLEKGLGDRISGLEKAVANDMQQMREGFRAQVVATEEKMERRIATLEIESAKLRQIAGATIAVALVCLSGLGVIAVPRLFGDRTVPPAVQTK